MMGLGWLGGERSGFELNAFGLNTAEVYSNV